jgi:hypothetical protein
MSDHEERAEQVSEQLQALLESLAAGAPDAAHTAPPDLVAEARLALTLADLLPTRPDPTFRAALQARLQTEVSQARGATGAWRPRSRWHALLPRLAAGVMACVLVVSSAVVASADSLPGDALYSVKRAAEEARLLLVLDPAERARQRLLLAQERLDEIVRLAESGGAVDEAVLARLLDARARALDEALGAPGEAAVRMWSDDAARTLRGLTGLDAGGAMLARAAADRIARPMPLRSGETASTPTARAAGATVEATGSVTPARSVATALATASLRAPTATTMPLPSPSPRATATAQAGLPAASLPPPSPVPLQPTVVAGQTDPAVNPVMTERAIVLTEQPRNTQAVPATPDSPPTGEPPSGPRP